MAELPSSERAPVSREEGAVEVPETGVETESARPEEEIPPEERIHELGSTITSGEAAIEKAEVDLEEACGDLDIDPGSIEAPGLESDKVALARMREDRRRMQEEAVEKTQEREGKQESERQERAYRRAAEKAREIIVGIDPAMTAEVVRADIKTIEGEEIKNAVVLKFDHPENQALRWTMSIEETDEYIDGRFEDVIRKIAAERETAPTYATEDYEDRDGGRQVDGLKELGEWLEGKEREMSPEEIAVLEEANRMTDALSRRFGLEPFKVTAEMVHVIKEEEWREEGTARYVEGLERIIVKEQPRSLIFKKKLVHEMTHLKSKNLLPRSLNEALTEQVTKELMAEFGEDPVTAGEVEESRRVIGAMPDHKALDGSRLFDEDTLMGYVDEGGRPYAERFTYGQERAVLMKLTEKIQERSKGRFNSAKEVFDDLVAANMTGDRERMNAVDEVLGRGTLERLGSIGDDVGRLRDFVESL